MRNRIVMRALAVPSRLWTSRLSVALLPGASACTAAAA